MYMLDATAQAPVNHDGYNRRNEEGKDQEVRKHGLAQALGARRMNNR